MFDISRSSIGSYEEGRAEPKIDTIIKIAKYFNISIDLLPTTELTVNALSDYTNNIRKRIVLEEKTEEGPSTKAKSDLYI